MGSEIKVAVDSSIYGLDIINRACYAFTGRYHVQIDRVNDVQLTVSFRPLGADAATSALQSEFSNALIDQSVRADLARETATIRDLIYRQAFVEADL